MDQLIATTFNSGNGGSIEITTEQLDISQGGQIIANTFSPFRNTSNSGDSGSLNIEATNIKLDGSSDFAASGLFSSAFLGSGDGGDINLKSDRLTISNGATINASNFPSRGSREAGTGKTGSINIETNYLELDNSTSDFPSSINTSTNNLDGGNIILNVTQDISINGNSKIASETRGDGNGGSIEIHANNLSLTDRGRVTVNSSSGGNAGNINIVTGDRLNSKDGKITANSDKSGGGDINLTADFINLQNDSEISTSVSDGTGGGGNITIDSRYVIGRNNSDIRANADEGDGGNIDITTDVILLSFDSEVDASSEFGLDGAVEIDSSDTNKRIGVVELPEKIVDPTALITAVCPIKDTETLVMTGKGGLAENPRQNLRGESVWEDFRDVNVSESADDPEIIEAKAWKINDKGKVELLSYVPQESKGDHLASFNQCRKP